MPIEARALARRGARRRRGARAHDGPRPDVGRDAARRGERHRRGRARARRAGAALRGARGGAAEGQRRSRTTRSGRVTPSCGPPPRRSVGSGTSWRLMASRRTSATAGGGTSPRPAGSSLGRPARDDLVPCSVASLRHSPPRMRLLAATAALFIAILSAVPASASPEDIFGYGTRSPAMGGTGVAHSDGFEAAYTNPALLSRIRDLKLTLGFAGGDLQPPRRRRGPAGRGPLRLDARDHHRHRPSAPARWGAEESRRHRARALDPDQRRRPGGHPLPGAGAVPPPPGPRAVGLRSRRGSGSTSGGASALGAGFAALAELDGSAVVATDATGRVGSNVQEQLVATYAPTFGLSFDVPLKDHETTRIGASYRGALAANFDVAIDATKLSSLNLPVLTHRGPRAVRPGASELRDRAEPGAVPLCRWRYVQMVEPVPRILEATVPCPASDPSCGSLDSPLDHVLEHDRPARRRRVHAAGTRSLSVHVRAGAFYEPSPLPSKLPSSQAFDPVSQQAIAVPTRYFDADRLANTLGYGYSAQPAPPDHARPLRTGARSHAADDSSRTPSECLPSGRRLGHSIGKVRRYGLRGGASRGGGVLMRRLVAMAPRLVGDPRVPARARESARRIRLRLTRHGDGWSDRGGYAGLQRELLQPGRTRARASASRSRSGT